jgi:hypothetical protein
MNYVFMAAIMLGLLRLWNIILKWMQWNNLKIYIKNKLYQYIKII